MTVRKHKRDNNCRGRRRPDAVINEWQPEIVAGGIAHDLNTILTTIYGYSELALETLDESSEASENIRQIIQAADRARALTGQLLTLGRDKEHKKIKVRVSDIISETVSFIKPSIPDNIEVIKEFTDPHIHVPADPVQLFRVFINLIVNAIRAMEHKGGTLTITLERAGRERVGDLSDSDYAIIRFADTGRGLSRLTSDRMFEPYFTSGRHAGGRGLGLSVVNKIIAEMEGDIMVCSRKNKGTVIDVLLPLATDSSTDD
jgi:signal transduction histidine kinase